MVVRALLIAGACSLALNVAGGLYVKHLRGALTDTRAELTDAKAKLKTANQSIKARDDAILAGAERERVAANSSANFWKGQTRAAFDAGYAAKRCAGEPVGVRPDLRTVWEAGRFTAGAMPVKPER